MISYDFDQSRHVFLRSRFTNHIRSECREWKLSRQIFQLAAMSDARFLQKSREGLDIIISSCTELANLPDTDDNQEMKVILRASIDDAQKKKDALVSELRSLPHVLILIAKVIITLPTPIAN
ncbi:hypothetical protein TNIN_193371 [Trichonephila inaurata madagascariensis]|uniref:Uncharacterized protein n=1 Tax=Trichonephila inaurata madagascariensis TaxID=2747483 RepID=A0A8X7CTH8_9ARAC|nr:hypothetical protein TNIN_193371 [Trichonephila inaurata madagascariensis]